MQNVAQESAGYFGQCRLERRGRLLLCVTSQMGIATLLVHVAKNVPEPILATSHNWPLEFRTQVTLLLLKHCLVFSEPNP